MSGKRPPLSRGQTFPIYTSPSLVDSTVSSLASLNLNIHTEDPRSSSIHNVNVPPPTVASDSHSQRHPQQQQQQQPKDTSYPTPPQSSTTPTMSQTSTPQSPHHHHHHHASSSSYFPPYPSSSSSSSSSTRYRLPSASSSPAVSPGIPLTTGRSGPATHPPSPAGPVITYPRNINTAFRGQADYRHRSNVAMTIDSTPSHYVLVAPLGDGFSADSITIAARKENILVIIADRWDQEQDCHNEWQVQFGRDSDMNKIHASFDNGVLKITVKRFSTMPNHP